MYFNGKFRSIFHIFRSFCFLQIISSSTIKSITNNLTMFARVLFVILFFFQCTNGFLYRPLSLKSRVKTTTLSATIPVGLISEIPNGERKIIDTTSGAIIIANVDGSFFAVNAKCPHLGLPMKKVIMFF